MVKNDIIIKGGQAQVINATVTSTSSFLSSTYMTPCDRLKGKYEVVDWGMNILTFNPAGTPVVVSCIGDPVFRVANPSIITNGDLNSLFYTIAKGMVLDFQNFIFADAGIDFGCIVYHSAIAAASSVTISCDYWIKLKRLD